MAVPLDAIRAIHNAFRKDMALMDEASVNAAQGRGDPGLVLKRYKFFNEVLVWHAIGEEEFVFPVMEKVAPLVSEPYERDHSGLDSLFDQLNKVVGSSDLDLIEVTRVTAAFNFHLRIHLDKEETHLYRIFNERVSLPEQGAIAGEMAQKIPQERFPELVSWLYPLISIDDRENMTRIWQNALPGQAFIKTTELIQASIGNDWSELTRRIPELNSIRQA